MLNRIQCLLGSRVVIVNSLGLEPNKNTIVKLAMDSLLIGRSSFSAVVNFSLSLSSSDVHKRFAGRRKWPDRDLTELINGSREQTSLWACA